MSCNPLKSLVRHLFTVISPHIVSFCLLLGVVLYFQQIVPLQGQQSEDSTPLTTELAAPVALSGSKAPASEADPALVNPPESAPAPPEIVQIKAQQSTGRSDAAKLPHHSRKARYLFARSTQLQFLDYDFARKYLEEAYLLSKEDRSAEVQKLLQISKEYSGDKTSDYWYLLATAYAEKWEKSRFDWLKKAFELDQWFEVPPLESALELTHILYKWGMYEDIINWAQKWKTEISDNKEIQFYLALAYKHSGQKKKAIELALGNLERFDYEERYFRILLDAPNISKEMWVNFHFYLENYPPQSPNLLRYLVSKSTNINHTENLLSVYTSLFGDDYFTTAQRILLRQDSLVPRSDIFFNNYKTSDFLILSQVIRSVSGVRPIEESLKDLNGLYIMDQNYDGFPEEEITFINGSLTERHVFPSNPNENDIKIRWNSYGEPASYHSFYNHNGSSRTVDILYGRYPFIREITITDRDSRRVYDFSPGRLTYSVSHEVPLDAFNWAITPLRRPTLLESEILKNSREAKLYETQYRQSDWKLRAKYSVNYLGELKEIQIDRDLDGTFDEKTSFVKGQRNRTLRDENQDGNFELVITYQNGIPQKYQVDINENGNTDYTEVLDEVQNKIWHAYGDLNLPASSYKYEEDPVDYIYSYYFKWSRQSISIFAPEYYNSLQ